MLTIIYTLIFCVSWLGLSPSKSCAGEVAPKYEFPYDLSEEDEKYKLDDHLQEISGLAYLGDKKIACVQDEKGNVYRFDLKDGESKKIFDFQKKGDFEGITYAHERIYVLQSNGDIYALARDDDKDPDERQFDTFLNSDFDAEGLAYDKRSNCLLVACKGFPGQNLPGQKAIYGFSLRTGKLLEKPKYLIETSLVDTKDEFAPSGIAVHPITGNIYVISTIAEALVVLSPKGKIRAVEKLKRSIFRQPEGICFQPDGDLFISNEGRDKRSNILKFKYKPND